MELTQSHPLAAAAASRPVPTTRKLVLGAALGTVIEWYDFFIYAILASVLARQFFSSLDEASAYIVTLLSFAAGAAVRPIGALVFGRYGDLLGRKRTFILTISITGLATFCMSLLPPYAAWGPVSAFLLIGLRLAQGFALGGEYGSAATYVAEHAPAGRRGFYTGWIQLATPIGQLIAMLVVLAVQSSVSAADFASWGWRIPFALSIVLLVLSLWIRLSALESPEFLRLQARGETSRAPLKETFLEWRHLRVVLLALFGLAAGQAVVINVGMTYSFFFLSQTLKVDLGTSNVLVATALAITAPLFVLFGYLSDRIDRRWLVLLGLAASAIAYRPVFTSLVHHVNPALEAASRDVPVIVLADPDSCSFQFNLTGTRRFSSSCDLAKAALTRRGIPYSSVAAAPGSVARIELGAAGLDSFEGRGLAGPDLAKRTAALNAAVDRQVTAAGYPKTADPQRIDKAGAVLLLSLLMALAALVYGPMAALLVEMFPARRRLSAVSTAYNIGNGWFGGFTSPIAFALVAAFGDLYAGLWYCTAVTGLTFVVALLFLRRPPADATAAATA
jgi:MFS family permease